MRPGDLAQASYRIAISFTSPAPREGRINCELLEGLTVLVLSTDVPGEPGDGRSWGAIVWTAVLLPNGHVGWINQHSLKIVQ